MDTWFLAGSTVLEGCGMFRRWNLTGGIGSTIGGPWGFLTGPYFLFTLLPDRVHCDQLPLTLASELSCHGGLIPLNYDRYFITQFLLAIAMKKVTYTPTLWPIDLMPGTF